SGRIVELDRRRADAPSEVERDVREARDGPLRSELERLGVELRERVAAIESRESELKASAGQLHRQILDMLARQDQLKSLAAGGYKPRGVFARLAGLFRGPADTPAEGQAADSSMTQINAQLEQARSRQDEIDDSLRRIAAE